MTQTPNKLEAQWEKEERTNRFLKKLVLYGSSALLVLGLGGLGGYFSRERGVTKSRQEISQLESKLEEQKTVNEATINYAASLSDSLYLRNVAIDSLNSVNHDLGFSYEVAKQSFGALQSELEFYTDEIKLRNIENGRLTTLLNNASAEKAALQDSVNTLNKQGKVYELKLQESQDEITRFKLIQGASQPRTIEIPGHFVVNPYYVGYGDSWDDGVGVRIGKSLLRSDKSSLFVYGDKEFFGNRDEALGLGAGIDYRFSDRVGLNLSYGTLGRAIFEDAERVWLGNLNASLHFEPLRVNGFKINLGGRVTDDKAAVVAGLSLGGY